MNATANASITVWLRVHRKGRQHSRWLKDTFASREKMLALIADHKQLHPDVVEVEIRESKPD
ncbi:MAG: hypothetical protein Aurels2KO_10630 [Aureliella sp.]